jgi:glycosyltransferase 2 family protein
MKTALQGLVGLVLAGLLLYWVFHDKDPKALQGALERASWGMLALGGALNFGHNHFRVLRWRWLLDPFQPNVRYRPMFAAVVLGYLTTWVIPGRIGELVRPGLLSAKEKVPLGPCMGSVIADRLLDGVAILVLFAVGSVTAVFAPGSVGLAAEIRTTAMVLLAVIVVALVGLLAVVAIRARFARWLDGAWPPVRWLGTAALGLAEGTVALRSPVRLAWIVVYSLVAWTTIALGTWIGVRAAGADVSFPAMLVMLPMLALGVAIPTPGGAGGYHAAMFAGLTELFGVEPTVAAGAALLMHLAIVLPVLVAGPVLLYTEKVSVKDLVAAAKEVKTLGVGGSARAVEVVP